LITIYYYIFARRQTLSRQCILLQYVTALRNPCV
jgi:hypothetical protein